MQNKQSKIKLMNQYSDGHNGPMQHTALQWYTYLLWATMKYAYKLNSVHTVCLIVRSPAEYYKIHMKQCRFVCFRERAQFIQLAKITRIHNNLNESIYLLPTTTTTTTTTPTTISRTIGMIIYFHFKIRWETSNPSKNCENNKSSSAASTAGAKWQQQQQYGDGGMKWRGYAFIWFQMSRNEEKKTSNSNCKLTKAKQSQR